MRKVGEPLLGVEWRVDVLKNSSLQRMCCCRECLEERGGEIAKRGLFGRVVVVVVVSCARRRKLVEAMWWECGWEGKGRGGAE